MNIEFDYRKIIGGHTQNIDEKDSDDHISAVCLEILQDFKVFISKILQGCSMKRTINIPYKIDKLLNKTNDNKYALINELRINILTQTSELIINNSKELQKAHFNSLPQDFKDFIEKRSEQEVLNHLSCSILANEGKQIDFLETFVSIKKLQEHLDAFKSPDNKALCLEFYTKLIREGDSPLDYMGSGKEKQRTKSAWNRTLKFLKEPYEKPTQPLSFDESEYDEKRWLKRKLDQLI